MKIFLGRVIYLYRFYTYRSFYSYLELCGLLTSIYGFCRNISFSFGNRSNSPIRNGYDGIVLGSPSYIRICRIFWSKFELKVIKTVRCPNRQYRHRFNNS